MLERTESRIRAVRESQGRSLREVARLAEVDVGQLSKIETGKQKPSVRTMVKVARVLGLRDLVRTLELWWPEDR